MKLKLVELFNVKNFYSLNKDELLKHQDLGRNVHLESVLVDEDSYNKLQTIPMLEVGEFKHLRFCKDVFSARNYLAQQMQSWSQIDNNTFSVGRLKKEHNF